MKPNEKRFQQFEEIVRDSYGLSLSGLFSAIGGSNRDLPFAKHKDAFFSMLRELLSSGRIRFIAPGADCYISPTNTRPKLTIEDVEAQWQASPDEIIAELNSHWPTDVSHENDPRLTIYFYTMPGLIWVGPDGKLIAS